MRILFLGFSVPRREIDRVLSVDREMPIQTHTFAWNVVDALVLAGCEVELVSASPMSNFPNGNPTLLVRGYSFRERCVEGRTISFVNAIVLKHVSRLVSGLVSVWSSFRRSTFDVLLIHGVHSPFLIIGVIVARLSRVKVVVILTDPPGVVLTTDSRLARALKMFDQLLVRHLVGRLDGVVSLSEGLHENLAPGLPCLLIDGIIGTDAPASIGEGIRDEHKLIYAGGLSDEYGVRALVEGVLGAETDCSLYIYGRGPLEQWISLRAEQSERIIGPMLVERGELLRTYQSAAGLVQPRPAGGLLASMSFPSKLMEYMCSGVPVLSTRLGALLPEFEDSVIWIRGDRANDFSRAIDDFFQLPEHERSRMASDARRLLLLTRSAEARGAQFQRFLGDILDFRF